MIIQIEVRHLLQYVWLLKSRSILLPDMYDGFSSNGLSWDYSSHSQLSGLVFDKIELARLNWFDELMIFQFVVGHM